MDAAFNIWWIGFMFTSLLGLMLKDKIKLLMSLWYGDEIDERHLKDTVIIPTIVITCIIWPVVLLIIAISHKK